MDATCIIHAWKDEQHRLSLSSDELALLPLNPAGSIELTSDLLDSSVNNPPDLVYRNLFLQKPVYNKKKRFLLLVTPKDIRDR